MPGAKENQPLAAETGAPLGHSETRFWTADYSAPLGPARGAGKYSVFIPASIATRGFQFSGEAATAVATAQGQLEQLRSRAQGPALRLARSLLRSESAASSRIEGMAASQQQIARAAYSRQHGHQEPRKAAEVLGNVEAMEHAITIGASGTPISPSDILNIHRALLRFTTDEPIAGKLRTDQNWIGGNDYNPLGATYTGPPPEQVPPLVEDLCEFINRDDLPPIAQAAIAHAQFENIHPFVDGNGRVGRALIYAILRRRKSIGIEVPPISLVLASRPRSYISGISGYREGRVSEWCLEFANATVEAAAKTKTLATAVSSLQDDFRAKLGKARSDSAAAQIIGLLPEYPILDVPGMEQATGKSNVAVNKAVKRLEAAGVISKTSVGAKRNRVWECSELLELLDALDRELALAPVSRASAMRA